MSINIGKFEFATNVLKMAEYRKLPIETVVGAIELLHRDICTNEKKATAATVTNQKGDSSGNIASDEDENTTPVFLNTFL